MHTCHTKSTQEQKLEDHCKFEAGWIYILSSGPARTTWQDLSNYKKKKSSLELPGRGNVWGPFRDQEGSGCLYDFLPSAPSHSLGKLNTLCFASMTLEHSLGTHEVPKKKERRRNEGLCLVLENLSTIPSWVCIYLQTTPG